MNFSNDQKICGKIIAFENANFVYYAIHKEQKSIETVSGQLHEVCIKSVGNINSVLMSSLILVSTRQRK